MKNKKTLILLAVTFIVACIAGLIIIGLYTNNQTRQNNNQISNESSQFNGKFVTADLPTGWEIVEYDTDEKEEQLLSDGEYSGLVSLEVQYNNEVVFALDGISGVGYREICGVINKFPDTESSYIESKQQEYQEDASFMNDQSSDNIPTEAAINELGSEYSEINIFDRQVRRIGSDLYWNRIGSTSFNPECGATSSFIQFSEPKFYTIDNAGTQHSLSLYTARISSGVSESQLMQLDKILDSLEII